MKPVSEAFDENGHLVEQRYSTRRGTIIVTYSAHGFSERFEPNQSEYSCEGEPSDLRRKCP